MHWTKMSQFSWPLMNILKENSDAKLALVILNMPLEDQYTLLKLLWRKAVVRLCIDGGCNRLYKANVDLSESYVPDLISGDFDSVSPEVLEFFKEKGVECIETQDQNFTDFTKCFQLLNDRREKVKVDYVVVLGAFGGRMDQVFANCQTLLEAEKMLPGVQVYLLSHENLVCLIPQGNHELWMDSGYEGDWCGLIPITGSCDSVTTTGLKWNLDKQQMMFGKLISTSNSCLEPKVSIVTDNYLLWTSGVKLK